MIIIMHDNQLIVLMTIIEYVSIDFEIALVAFMT